jgi:hypothetical protein
MHEFADLPVADYVRRNLPLSDTRRNAAWQAANPTQFQKLVDETLAGLQVGADEPGRKVGARRQLEARAPSRHVRAAADAADARVCLRGKVRRRRATCQA